MKKAKKYLIIFFISIFFLISQVDASWSGNATGGGSGSSKGGASCNACYSACHHTCNNAWFTILRMSLVYYDGSNYEKIGKTIHVGDYSGYDPNNTDWGSHVFSGLDVIHWNKIKGLVNNDTSYGTKIKKAVLSDVNTLLSWMGTNKSTLENDIKSGKYSKHMEPKGNVSDTGIRIIAEVYFGYAQSTCSGCGGFKNYYGTIKGIGAQGKMAKSRFATLANTLKLEYSDIGFYKPSVKEPTLAEASASNAGWGIGIFSPWAEGTPPDGGGDSRCNPGTTAATIKACCDLYGITASNKKNNTTKYLTKVISDANLQKYCPDKAPTHISCSYSLSDDMSDKCTTKTKGYITDENNEWNCVFYSTKAPYSEVKNHFIEGPTSSNDYCAIYCRERVDYEFPLANTTVYAGQYMVVKDSVLDPSIWPIKYTATKTCRTTKKESNFEGYINVKQFEQDMAANEIAIKNAWDNYRKLYAQQEACNKASYSGSGTHSDCVEYGEITYTYEGKKYTTWGCKKSESRVHYNYSGGKATYDGQTYTCSYTTSPCGCYTKPNYNGQIASAKATYDSLINKRNSMINQLNQCNHYDVPLTFEPKLTIEYEEPIYGQKFNLKISNTQNSSYNRYYTSGNATEGSGSYQGSAPTKTMKIRNCTWDHCRNEGSLTYPVSAWVEYQKKTKHEYGLEDNVYRYIAKYSSRSFHKEAQAGANYTLMPFSNLPVHVSTYPGKYDFKITTTTYGTNNKFTKYVFTGNTFAGISYKKSGLYNCEYTVSCERFLVKKDCAEFKNRCGKQYKESGCSAELIYRTISLDADKKGGTEFSLAFLKQNGDPRTPGYNWKVAGRVNEFITENRGVKGYEVYKQDPMYEITLTPSLMKTIREYNKKMNNVKVTVYEGTSLPTTGVAGYTSQDGLVCKSNGETCTSKIIRTWGVKGCAIKSGKAGYTKCTGVTAW